MLANFVKNLISRPLSRSLLSRPALSCLARLLSRSALPACTAIKRADIILARPPPKFSYFLPAYFLLAYFLPACFLLA